jgi:hypothetical protein
VAHAAQAVTHVKLDHYSAASPLSARRRWRLVDRLGEQIIRELLTDSRAGTPQRELAERYGISVSTTAAHRYRGCATSGRNLTLPVTNVVRPCRASRAERTRPLLPMSVLALAPV